MSDEDDAHRGPVVGQPAAGGSLPGAALPFGDGTAILRTGGGTARYLIDPGRAPQTIAAFQKAADDMRLLISRAERLGTIEPPGLDGVSRNAVKEMGEWAMGERGSLRMALDAGAASLEAAAANLQAQLDAFLAAEGVNTMRSDGSAL
ncbi:MAG: hypothetical protein M3R63_10135 [Actinomycetota bacterium]|nr:hypothetical protein [Actinomycetota bacterium]